MEPYDGQDGWFEDEADTPPSSSRTVYVETDHAAIVGWLVVIALLLAVMLYRVW